MPSLQNEQTYWQEFLQIANAQNISFGAFEAYDEPNKDSDPTSVENHWGLMQTNSGPIYMYSMFKTAVTSIMPLAPPGTSADMIMRNGTNGDYEIYDIGNNAVLTAYPLFQVALEWQAAGVGGFYGTDTSDMILRDSTTGAFEVYDVSNNEVPSIAALGQVGLEWQVVGFGDFSGNANETDMLMRNSNTGVFEYYDISKNTITAAGSMAVSYPMGTVASQWAVAGFGDFGSGNANETDMMMRAISGPDAGALEIYDIRNNAAAPPIAVGAVGLEWTVAGFGDFSSNPGESDMLMRATSGPYAGGFEVYDISHNAITSAVSMGAVGLEWTVAGFGDFSGNANETDMLMRAISGPEAGAFEVYDISHNAITFAGPMGAVGLEWTVAGFSADPPAGSLGASTAQLVEAMASLGASAAVNGAPGASLGSAETPLETLMATPH